MKSPLIDPIAEALAAFERAGFDLDVDPDDFVPDAVFAADACIAVVAALPSDYTAADVLAYLRGESA